MSVIIVLERPEAMTFNIPGVEVVAAREYLANPEFGKRRGLKVFNLSRSYRYQSVGYYVSLLALARGHRPLPSVSTIQDLRSRSLVKVLSEDLDGAIQKSLSSLTSDRFELSVYFGTNLAQRHRRLARQLFNIFPAPLLRASFARNGHAWSLRSIRPIGVREVPDSHRDFLAEAATTYFSRRGSVPSTPAPLPLDLAVLLDPDEPEAPSNEGALRRFERAARDEGIAVERIGKDDFGRLPEFDALFIRATTAVDDYTFRFSRRADAEGLAVIDDPESIVRCTNKVFLAELLARHKVPIPRTVALHRDNIDQIPALLGFPMILKLPDSSFSLGVKRVDDEREFRERTAEFLAQSELAVAQEYVPTDFDWRVGVLDREILYAARYRMAPGHWQIVQRKGERTRYGGVEALPLDQVPPRVLEVAGQAAGLVGDGLYGVDLKTVGDRVVVMEVNDNPTIDRGYEDAVLGMELYQRLARSFKARIERLKRREGP